MIQKLVYKNNKTAVGVTTTATWCNKELSFFLLKRKLFLFKNLKKINFLNKKKGWQQAYMGSNLAYGTILKSLLKRLRSDRATLQNGKKKFIFYRIKKNFKNVNKIARGNFFNITGIKIPYKNWSKFFTKSKNLEKSKILSRVGSICIDEKLILGFFSKPDLRIVSPSTNDKSQLTEILLSKHSQMFILSNDRVIVRKHHRLPIYEDATTSIKEKEQFFLKKKFEKSTTGDKSHQYIANSYDITKGDLSKKKSKLQDFQRPGKRKKNRLHAKTRLLFLLRRYRIGTIKKQFKNPLPTNVYKLPRRPNGRIIKRLGVSVTKWFKRLKVRRLQRGAISERTKKSTKIFNKLNRLSINKYEVPINPDISKATIRNTKLRKMINRPQNKSHKIGNRFLLKKKKNSIKYLKPSKRLNKLNSPRSGQNHFITTNINNSFVDSRQLLAFRYKKKQNTKVQDSILFNVNLFNFRSYNWRIVT